ncbi:MAG: type II CAAX endopeptidase family protein [Clostridia bacterium]
MINYKYKNSSPDIIAVAIFILLTLVSIFNTEINNFFGGFIYYFYTALTIIVFLLGAILLKGKSDVKTKKFFLLKRFKMRMLPITIYAALIVCLLTVLINILFVNVFKFTDALSVNPMSSLNEQSPISSFLAVVLAPAIFEELFFRGAYFNSYKSYGIWAFLASALTFGFMHATPFNFIGPVLAGFVFCILVFIFDSIYPAILAHLINNIVVFLLSIYGEKIHSAGLDGFYIIICILILLVLCYLFIGKITPYLHKISDKENVSLKKSITEKTDTKSPFNIWFFALAALWLTKCVLILTKVI